MFPIYKTPCKTPHDRHALWMLGRLPYRVPGTARDQPLGIRKPPGGGKRGEGMDALPETNSFARKWMVGIGWFRPIFRGELIVLGGVYIFLKERA